MLVERVIKLILHILQQRRHQLELLVEILMLLLHLLLDLLNVSSLAFKFLAVRFLFSKRLLKGGICLIMWQTLGQLLIIGALLLFLVSSAR